MQAYVILTQKRSYLVLEGEHGEREVLKGPVPPEGVCPIAYLTGRHGVPYVTVGDPAEVTYLDDELAEVHYKLGLL